MGSSDWQMLQTGSLNTATNHIRHKADLAKVGAAAQSGCGGWSAIC